MNLKNIFLVTLLLTLNSVVAQDYKFGKVSKEELIEEINSVNQEAHATVLYKKHKVFFEFNQDDGFMLVNSYHERIKIYDKEGFEWATKRFSLYNYNNKSEKLTNLKAYTFTLENDGIKKTKLKKEGIFDEKNNKYWSTKTLTMPNVKEGCVIEFEYAIRSPFMKINDIVLQYDIPIKKLDVDVIIPEYFIYNKSINPRAVFNPELEDYSTKRSERITSKTRSKNLGFSAVKTNIESSDLNFNEKGFKVSMNNIPALKSEPFVQNVNIYRAKIIMEYAAYKGLDNLYKNYSTTWDVVTKTISNSSSFGGELEKNKYFEEDIDALISETDKPENKIVKIYNFVKTKVKHNNFIGLYSNEGVKRAYKEGVGNIAEINLILTAMLRYSGLNANPVILSTRDNGTPLYPNTEGFNYVISAIEDDTGNLILLDAANENSAINILPESAINWQGRIIRKNGSSDWISLNPKKISKEIVMLKYNINNMLEVEGKVSKQITDYLALDYRDKNNGLSEAEHLVKLQGEKDDLEILNLKVKNERDNNKPIVYSYDFKLNNNVDEIDGKLYIAPTLFLNYKENPFKQDIRVYPIDFIYPISRDYLINIDIPEGYIVESLPENVKFQFNVTGGSFSYLIYKTENTLQLKLNYKLNKTFILPSEYNQFKEFFSSIFEKQSEKIILIKT